MRMINNGLSYWQAETEGIDLLDLTMGDLLDQRAEENPLHEAIVYSCYPEFGDALSIRWTYQDYQDRANAVAKGLLALGLQQGDHIAILAANVPEWPLLMMGAAKAGLVLVTINPVLRAAEIEYILKQGDVRALFFMARVRDYDHLATMNAQGYLNIVGRLKDMVIRGGENLFPVEIEEFLLRHPKVAQVQVVGVPDAFFGEELLAVVIPRAGEQLTEEELRAYCQGQISHQKIPRYFQFVESYPLTASGKVQKFILREQAIRDLGLDEAAKIKTA